MIKRNSIITLLLFLLRNYTFALQSNAPESPQPLHDTTTVCKDRSDDCEVELDVPSACVDDHGGTSDCPIVFFIHGFGGTNDGFYTSSGVHDAGVIGIYPQGESCPKPGWNTGPKDCNQCEWDDYDCTLDADEGAFVKGIIDELRSMGANGNLYAIGNSNGAALAHRLAINLPFKGIIAKVTQLLAIPERSGPGDLNYNQPRPGNPPVSVLTISGTADGLIPYEGGSSAVFGGNDNFELMSNEESNLSWANHNNCDTTPVITMVTSSVGTGTADYYAYPCDDGIIVEHYKVYGGDHVQTGRATLGGKDAQTIEYDFIERCEEGSSPTAPTVIVPTSPVAAPVSPPVGGGGGGGECVDSTTWYGKKTAMHTCSVVAQNPEIRCRWENSEGVTAMEACAASCNDDCDTSNAPITSPVAVPTTPPPVASPVESPTTSSCVDDPSFSGKYDPDHNCEWVAEFPNNRCHIVGSEGVKAMDACAATCNDDCDDASPVAAPASPVAPFVESPDTSCIDDSTFSGHMSPEHDCDWVSEVPSFRCNIVSSEGIAATVACPASCQDDCLGDTF